jgi:putative transposase
VRVFGLPGPICRLARRPPPELSPKAQERLRCVNAFRALIQQGLHSEESAQVLGIPRATLYRWYRRLKSQGPIGLEAKSRSPNRKRKPTWSLELIELTKKLREEHPGWGKDKLVVLLHRQGFMVSTSMVGRIITYLKARGVLREAPRYPVKGTKRLRPRPYGVRKPKDHQVREPGDLIELDTLDIRPLPGVLLKHFTAQDTTTRWDVISVHSRATAATATHFLDELKSRLPFPVKAIQVDGGSEFMASFEEACRTRGIRLFILPPRSPELNGQVERAHRTHIEEFYELYDGDWTQPDLNQALLAWELKYNTIRPHQALKQLTPLEYLKQCHQKMTLQSHI